MTKRPIEEGQDSPRADTSTGGRHFVGSGDGQGFKLGGMGDAKERKEENLRVKKAIRRGDYDEVEAKHIKVPSVLKELREHTESYDEMSDAFNGEWRPSDCRLACIYFGFEPGGDVTPPWAKGAR